MFLILNGILYSLGWYLSLYLAVKNHFLWAFTVPFLFILVQFVYLYKIDKKTFYQDLFLIFYALFFGYFLEFLLTRMHLIAYVNATVSVPAYILVLYPLFALTINHSLKWIQKNRFIPLIIGGLAPLIYGLGFKIGACDFPLGFTTMALVTLPLWAFFLFFLCLLNFKLKEVVQNVFSLVQKNEPLTILFDGDCPICSKEICWLKNKAPTNLNFVNIASDKYIAEDFKGVDYKTAMQEMHAIHAQSKIVKGLDAFVYIYSSMGWILVPILLQAPIFKSLLNFFYQLFAKYRLMMTGRR